MLHGTRSQQTRTKIILGSPGKADETPPRRLGCIYRSMETHLAHTKQRLHHQIVDATQPRDVPTSGLDYSWQRAGIMGDQHQTTSRLSKAGALKPNHENQGTRLLLCQRH